MVAESLARLRGRLEGARSASGETAIAHELTTALAELEALWDELQHQSDVVAAERYRYAFLFDHAPYACVVTNMHGMVREANLSAFRLLDIAAPQMLKKPLAVFLDEADRAPFRARLAEALAEPRRAAEPLEAKLKLARPMHGAVEIRLHCMKETGEAAPAVMCFLRPLA